MFTSNYRVVDPEVVTRKWLPNKEFTFEVTTVEGDFFFVTPSSAKEVLFLQMLGKNIDLFVPAVGDGLLVRGHIILSLTPLPD